MQGFHGELYMVYIKAALRHRGMTRQPVFLILTCQLLAHPVFFTPTTYISGCSTRYAAIVTDGSP